MVDIAVEQETPITALCASQTMDPSMKEIRLTEQDWQVLKDTQKLFAIFVKPTIQLQASEYPTLNFVIPLYYNIKNKLTELQREQGRESAIGAACGAALFKLNEYHDLSNKSERGQSIIAAILDPRMNLRIFDKLMPYSSQSQYRQRAKSIFQGIWSKYALRQRNREAVQLRQSVESVPEANDSDDDLYSSEQPTLESEDLRWLKERSPGRHTDVLNYWKSKEIEYPVMAWMARDYLAIPASSAPSERVFSNEADVITKKRNRLAPDTLRYLLCMRSWGVLKEDEIEDEMDADDECEEDAEC